MNNRHVYILAAILTFIGLFTAYTRSNLTGIPFSQGELAPAWVLERQVEWESDGGPVKVEMQMPTSDTRFDVIGEQVIAPRFGVVETTDAGNRTITVAKREASGPQAVYTRSGLHLVHHKKIKAMRPTENPGLDLPEVSDAQKGALSAFLDLAVPRSADDVTLVPMLLGLMKVDQLEDNLLSLTKGRTDTKARADAAVVVLGYQGIPARRVNGIRLRDTPGEVELVHWLEIWTDGFWVPFDVDRVKQGIPNNYVALWRGTGPMDKLTGAASNLQVSMSTFQIDQRLLDQVLDGEDVQQRNLLKFSLYSLPIETQHALQTMLVVPLGIVFLVVLRNIVGVRSLGTFMPVLIALALHSTYLTWGVPLFVAIIAAGLLFRLYLEHLKLLLVPRLAAVLVFVIILLTGLSMITHALGLPQGLSVALFPMVIMTMTIERLSILWDERGAAEAIKQGISSLLIAIVLCIIISFEQVQYLFFAFPELLLVFLAIALLLGRYTGYRLTELPRFREMATAKETP